MRAALCVLLLVLAGSAAVPAVAAPAGPPVHFRGDDVVQTRLSFGSNTITQGGSVEATVELTPDPGWHLYGPEHGDAGAPPAIAWNLPRDFHAGPIAYPPSQRVTHSGLTTYEYHGPTKLRVRLDAQTGVQPGRDVPVRADISWLVCSNVCVPGSETVRGSLTVAPASATAAFVGALVASAGALVASAGALGLAFLGGLILNLMPCVFPVLSFKAMRLIGEPIGEGWRSGLAYVAGVMASCTALGGILLVARGAGNAVGWGFQLQSPVFVGFIAVLLLALALAMSGLVELTVPVPQRVARGAGTAGAFGDGVLVTLIASACVAPYMGAALAFALTASVPVAVALFAALGLGLALPQGVLMTVPAFLRWLPAPGPWMLTARRVLAVPLIVTAGWLGWVFVQEITPTPSSSIASFGGATFTTARLSELRAHHQAVLVDISAAWCITCKVNERITLDRPEVTSRLKQLNVTVLRGDWTKQDPAITAYLRSLGSAGVPLYAYYSPNGKIDLWPQVLTPSLVLGRLEEAKREASVRPSSTPV